VVITPTWNVTRTQLNIFTGGLTKYLFDNYMYHWGPVVDGLRWDSQGFVDQDEIDFHIAHGEGMAAGGGFYISEDKYDSQGFGPWPTVVVIPAGTLRYSDVWAGICFGRIPTKDEKAHLGRIVPFIDEYWLIFSKWRVVHSAKLTQQVMSGPRAPEKYRIPWERIGNVTSYRALHLTGAPPKFTETDEFKQVTRHWGLIDYLQPVGAKCALMLYPDDPFKAVDAKKFANFVEIANRAGVMTRQPWEYNNNVLNKTGDFYNEVWTLISGEKDNSNMYRSKEMRYGSQENNYTVALTTAQLYNLGLSNYLTVNQLGNLPNNLTLVEIYHPDAVHLPASVSYRLSSSVMSQYNKYTKDQIKNNTEVREMLTRLIIKDLMQYELRYMSTYGFPDLQVIRNLAAIAPFSDYNDQLLSVMFRAIGAGSELRQDFNFPISLLPFIPNAGSNFFNNEMLIQKEQWKEYLGRIFNGPKMGPLTQKWNTLDNVYPRVYNQWNSNYTKDDCKALLQGDWMQFMDSVAKGWRGVVNTPVIVA